MKVWDNKIYRDGEKIAWIEGHHIRAAVDGRTLGYFDSKFVYTMDAHSVAYIHENELRFENNMQPISLEKVNEEIEGTAPLVEKCAIHVLLED